jgi:hypothetical protein
MSSTLVPTHSVGLYLYTCPVAASSCGAQMAEIRAYLHHCSLTLQLMLYAGAAATATSATTVVPAAATTSTTTTTTTTTTVYPLLSKNSLNFPFYSLAPSVGSCALLFFPPFHII